MSIFRTHTTDGLPTEVGATALVPYIGLTLPLVTKVDHEVPWTLVTSKRSWRCGRLPKALSASAIVLKDLVSIESTFKEIFRR